MFWSAKHGIYIVSRDSGHWAVEFLLGIPRYDTRQMCLTTAPIEMCGILCYDYTYRNPQVKVLNRFFKHHEFWLLDFTNFYFHNMWLLHISKDRTGSIIHCVAVLIGSQVRWCWFWVSTCLLMPCFINDDIFQFATAVRKIAARYEDSRLNLEPRKGGAAMMHHL